MLFPCLFDLIKSYKLDLLVYLPVEGISACEEFLAVSSSSRSSFGLFIYPLCLCFLLRDLELSGDVKCLTFLLEKFSLGIDLLD